VRSDDLLCAWRKSYRMGLRGPQHQEHAAQDGKDERHSERLTGAAREPSERRFPHISPACDDLGIRTSQCSRTNTHGLMTAL